ncbi:unnamed protein product, partial [Mesorhabditis spiculigera]
MPNPPIVNSAQPRQNAWQEKYNNPRLLDIRMPWPERIMMKIVAMDIKNFFEDGADSDAELPPKPEQITGYQQKRDVKLNTHCTDEDLAAVLKKNIDGTSRKKSKDRVAENLKLLDKQYDVICSSEDFSYHINTHQFCQMRIGNVICLAFPHNF